MVQGGGFEPGMNQKGTDAPIENKPERPEERQLHRGHGPYQRPALGHRAVLHQRGRQRLPEPHRPQRPGAGATPCSARWSVAPMWWTRSRPCPRTGASMTTCPRRRRDREGRGTLICKDHRDPDRAPVRGLHAPSALAHGRFIPTCTCRPLNRHRGRMAGLPAKALPPTRCSSWAICSRSGWATMHWRPAFAYAGPAACRQPATCAVLHASATVIS